MDSIGPYTPLETFPEKDRTIFPGYSSISLMVKPVRISWITISFALISATIYGLPNLAFQDSERGLSAFSFCVSGALVILSLYVR